MADGFEGEGVAVPTQEAILAAPTFYVDASVGIASAAGVARLTLGTLKFNGAPDATLPILHPTVTIIVPEALLLQMARDLLDRGDVTAESSGEEQS